MPTLSPSDVLAASGFVARELDLTKRRALAALAAMWETADPDDVAGSLGRFNPLVVQVMHQQQAAGRVTAWTQAQLAASVASDALPGEAALGISAARDGLMLSGASFEQVIAPTVPGVLSRIAAGVDPGTALDMAQRIQASMVGSVAHDEARATTQDVVEGDFGHSSAITGYARRTEGSWTCDFCRMLATRGPVYRKDTGGFRAHAFCDCTVYAVAMSDFTTSPGDWEAYQRWAKTHGGSPKGGTSLTPSGPAAPAVSRLPGAQTQERLTAIDAQLASYEPVLANGSGTKWMREQVERLKAERQALLAGGVNVTPSAVPIRKMPAPAPDLTPKPWRKLTDEEALDLTAGIDATADAATKAKRLADVREYVAEWELELSQRQSMVLGDQEFVALTKSRIKELRQRSREGGMTESQIRRDPNIKYWNEEIKRTRDNFARNVESANVASDMLAEARSLVPMVERTGRSWAVIRQGLRDVGEYDVHVSGPHVVRVMRSAHLHPAHVERFLSDVDSARTSLPEWRRVTFDGRERPYQVWVNDRPQAPAIALGSVGDNQIWIRPDVVSLGDMPWVPGQTELVNIGHLNMSPNGRVLDTLNHEMGHNLDTPHSATTRAMFDRVNADGSLSSHLSGYGRKNELEAYAETYSRWVMDPASTNPLVRAYVDEFGWDVPRAAYNGAWREVVTDAYRVY